LKGCCPNDAALVGNKVGNAITNNPSMLYSFMGDNVIGGHSMVRVGFLSPKCNNDHNF